MCWGLCYWTDRLVGEQLDELWGRDPNGHRKADPATPVKISVTLALNQPLPPALAKPVPTSLESRAAPNVQWVRGLSWLQGPWARGSVRVGSLGWVKGQGAGLAMGAAPPLLPKRPIREAAPCASPWTGRRGPCVAGHGSPGGNATRMCWSEYNLNDSYV